MEVLFHSVGAILIALCSVAWSFFIGAQILELPIIKRILAEQIKSFVQLKEKKLESVIKGISVRMIGFVHNTIQITLSLWALNSPILWEDTWHGATKLSQVIAIISAGFFLWDTAVAIRRASADGAEFILHGALCFCFYFYVACTGNFHFYGCSFLLWELSTPFVHLRWLLYKIGKQNSVWYLYNGIGMVVVFGLCRIIWGGYLGARYFISSFTPQNTISSLTINVMRVICVALNGLNWFWYSKILSAAMILIFGKPSVTHNGAVKSAKKEKKES
eukprot:g1247.t1